MEFGEKSTELKGKGTVSEKKVRYFIKTEQEKSKVCRLAGMQTISWTPKRGDLCVHGTANNSRFRAL